MCQELYLSCSKKRCHLCTIADAFRDVLNDFSSDLCLLSTSQSKIPYFICDHRESSSCFTSSCSFNGSIKGQDVCLERYIIYRFDDFVDLLGRYIDFILGDYRVK